MNEELVKNNLQHIKLLLDNDILPMSVKMNQIKILVNEITP